jgi:hypothetical protein
MSYDLVFWRELNGYAGSPAETYARLIERQRVEGLADLAIGAMLARLQEVFPTLVREGKGDADWAEWVSENQQDSFQVEWTAQSVIVACRHVHTDEMNRIIDWAATFECPLFDAQTGERFAVVQ